MKKNKLQAIRGMNDIVPQAIPYWEKAERILKDVVMRYGYHEIRFPIVESTELFVRVIGEVTDIVEKEMYTFSDRNGDSLTLRPEGTAGCVRAALEQGLLHNQIQRLWYQGPMFRHERPQKGRYRQFYQFGVEAFGLSGPDLDAELLLMAKRIFCELGIENKLTLEINNLGSLDNRITFQEKLVEYFKKNFEGLDEDSKRRLSTNPLRILDSKNPAMSEVLKNAPKILDFLDPKAESHFKQLCFLLDQNQLKYRINPCLVRGLDYYNFTVFEWQTNDLGAQGAVCAGGRYDSLVEQLGGHKTSAAGFAIGMERLVALFSNQPIAHHDPHVYLVLVGDGTLARGLQLSEKLRDEIPALRVLTNFGAGNFSAQLKRADRSQAVFALIIGEEEMNSQSIIVKHLRAEGNQERVNWNDISNYLAKLLNLELRHE
jgi:histidyl-tRNA synthetase